MGVDTPSTDYGQSRDFKTHQILGSANVWGLENVANLDKLPSKGAIVFNMVYKLKEGSGAPSRQENIRIMKKFNLFLWSLIGMRNKLYQ